MATAEASSNLARFDGARYGRRAGRRRRIEEMYRESRSQGFGAEVKRRIMLGTYVLSAGYYDAYYKKAQQVRTLLRGDFEHAFESVRRDRRRPTSPEVAFELGSRRPRIPSACTSPTSTPCRRTSPALPGISLPCGQVADDMPVGLQLLGRALDEATLLRVADAFQRRTDHHTCSPVAGDRMSDEDECGPLDTLRGRDRTRGPHPPPHRVQALQPGARHATATRPITTCIPIDLGMPGVLRS